MFTLEELNVLYTALKIDIASDQQQQEQKVQLLRKIESLIENYQNIN